MIGDGSIDNFTLILKVFGMFGIRIIFQCDRIKKINIKYCHCYNISTLTHVNDEIKPTIIFTYFLCLVKLCLNGWLTPSKREYFTCRRIFYFVTKTDKHMTQIYVPSCLDRF